MRAITIVGCGNMGGAIARGLIKSGKHDVTVYDPYASDVPEGAERLTDLTKLNRDAVVLIAVKPQYITKGFLSSISGAKGYISIAAGIPLEVLSRNFPATPIARFMPNIAAKAQKSVTAVAFNDEADDDYKAMALEVASSFGSAFPLEEKQFSAFIGISGSLIAYALEFVNQSAMGGVEAGIPYPTSYRIVSETLKSACALLDETGKSPAELIPSVCSAAGTTIEGMRALAEGGFAPSLYDAVMRAAERSTELENNAKENLA